MRKKEMERLKGTVKWFDARKGFGFLSDEDGLDYFVHFSEIQAEGFRKLRNGQQVTFEAGEDSKGRGVARNVMAEPEDISKEEIRAGDGDGASGEVGEPDSGMDMLEADV